MWLAGEGWLKKRRVEDNVAVKPPHYLWLKVAPFSMAQPEEKRGTKPLLMQRFCFVEEVFMSALPT
jgi:hypothetical protein